MTPAKSKAKKLIGRFKSCANGAVGSESLFKNSRKCALICVDEILKLRMIHNIGRDINYSEGEFWKEVKSEILKQTFV